MLSVRGLTTELRTEQGRFNAVDSVSFDLFPGEVLGIVGESGCGKSMTALSILGLVPRPPGRIVAGEVLFEGRDLVRLPERELQRVRGAKIAMIFQEPMTSLNPVFTIGDQLAETLRHHERLGRRAARARAVELLARVGIPAPAERLDSYPHELSGGMRQRVMIAIALACNPKVLLADEPTTALDVTIQAQILDLLERLQAELGMAVVIITHDLGIVAEFAHRVLVMYAGRVIEEGPVAAIFDTPAHPYTRGLLASLPDLEGESERLVPIPGNVPVLAELPPGCRFAPRCGLALPACRAADPPLHRLGPRAVACVRASLAEAAKERVA
ncbi:MAG: ABC transporter ATP-binding protein [Geminicoccaceae bacterium]|nr:ABC transporter ATP-binding protein [Geminicoccaceae bacterium]MCX8102387.1 ABC transporter ATP-binding protein [Geminicoccaceae bacterium]